MCVSSHHDKWPPAVFSGLWSWMFGGFETELAGLGRHGSYFHRVQAGFRLYSSFQQVALGAQPPAVRQDGFSGRRPFLLQRETIACDSIWFAGRNRLPPHIRFTSSISYGRHPVVLRNGFSVPRGAFSVLHLRHTIVLEWHKWQALAVLHAWGRASL